MTAPILAALLDIDAALDAIYHDVDELLRLGRFGEVDRLLAGVDPSKHPAIVTLAFISIAFVARDVLPEWRPLVQRARAYFEKFEPARVDALLQGWEDRGLMGGGR